MKLQHQIKLAFVLVIALLTTPQAIAQVDVEFNQEERHHISTFLGGTDLLETTETAFTLGLDYEYRVNRLLGAGAVLEHAFGDLNSTTFLVVADIHIWRGLVTQIGPGFEVTNGETHFAARFGALYEFVFDENLTVSPQIHYDISEENSLVFGLAFGFGF